MKKEGRKGLAVWLSVAIVVVVSAPTSAFADVIGPDEMACQGRAAGAACITAAGSAGTCETRTLPVGAPDSGGSRMAVICTATTGADSGGGSEPPPSGGGCRCAAAGAGAKGHGPAAAFALAGACVLAVLRRRRRAVAAVRR